MIIFRQRTTRVIHKPASIGGLNGRLGQARCGAHIDGATFEQLNVVSIGLSEHGRPCGRCWDESIAAVPHDDAPHPSGNDRFAIYAVNPHAERRRGEPIEGGSRRRRIAETSESGIGMTLRALLEEGQLTQDDRIGILDRQTRTWIINPWAQGRRS